MRTPTLPALFAPAFHAADRQAARAAWGRHTVAELRRLNTLIDQSWDERLAADPEIDDATFDALPASQEQARLEILLAQVQAATDHDRWPGHLYWGGL